MNLTKLKKEFPTIIYLVVVQTYLNFTFPVFTRLGKPFNFILPFILSICCIYIFIYMITKTNGYPVIHDQEHLDGAPEQIKNGLKIIEKTIVIVISHFGLLFAMYYNIYNIHQLYYIIYYLHGIITIYLIGRAANH